MESMKLQTRRILQSMEIIFSILSYVLYRRTEGQTLPSPLGAYFYHRGRNFAPRGEVKTVFRAPLFRLPGDHVSDVGDSVPERRFLKLA
jgi:hypothetical protein